MYSVTSVVIKSFPGIPVNFYNTSDDRFCSVVLFGVFISLAYIFFDHGIHGRHEHFKISFLELLEHRLIL